jgi:hypothetical protein
MSEQSSKSKARTTTRGAAGSNGKAAAPKKKATTSTTKSATAKTPTVRFTGDWREDVVGDVRAGSKLRVEYAPDRMPGSAKAGVIAEVMFSPGGQHHSGRVSGGRFDITVPDDAREMTIWFHRTEGGATSWDSRFGANYSFPVQSSGTNRRPASAA